MTSRTKATNFAKHAKVCGWGGTIEFDDDTEYAKVTAKRGSEVIEVEWINNQLVGPPSHTLAGVKANLHCAATAKRVMEGQPDMDLHMKRAKRAARKAKASEKTSSTEEASEEKVEQHVLPFDVWESPDHVILRALRGSTIIWRNRISGLPEMDVIPVERNRDLQNTFFLSESKDGKPFVSFMNNEGVFRAVHLESILQVK